MSGTDAVIEAARRLAGPENGSFHVSDLVVAAWRLCPEKLGLSDYERQYPDSNVIKALLSKDGGRAARALQRVGPNRYRMRLPDPEPDLGEPVG